MNAVFDLLVEEYYLPLSNWASNLRLQQQVLNAAHLKFPFSMGWEALTELVVEGRSGYYPRVLMFFYLVHQARIFALSEQNFPSDVRFTAAGLACRFLTGFVCYCYPCAVACDLLLFARTPRVMLNGDCFLGWLFLFLSIHHFFPCIPVESDGRGSKFINKGTNVVTKLFLNMVKFGFLLDATRAAYNTLEKADEHAFLEASVSDLNLAARLPLVLWTLVLVVGSPGMLKALFFGRNDFWKDSTY